MTQNVGSIEKIIRSTAGIALIGISIFMPFTHAWWRILTGGIGLIFLFTGASGF